MNIIKKIYYISNKFCTILKEAFLKKRKTKTAKYKEIPSDKNLEKTNSLPFTNSILYINKPISTLKDDVIGFDVEVKTIETAINNGANMIGLVGDYGVGKSSIVDLLYTNNKYTQKIKINLWDSILKIDNKKTANSNISLLTKSFLYQLAKGYDNKEENIADFSKLSPYVSKALNNNYNIISFATAIRYFWNTFGWPLFFFALYFVFTGNKSSYQFHSYSGAFLKDISPIFLLISIVTFITKTRNHIAMVFTNAKRSDNRVLEINDAYDVFSIISEKLVKNDYNAKQIVIIEDLDRITDKELIIGFLKEVYRFHNILSDKTKDDFVFIIALKPESLLITNSDAPSLNTNGNTEENGVSQKNPLNKSNINTSNKEKLQIDDSHIYSKIFDLILYLKPIHFSDYEQVLMNLINSDEKTKNKLINLLETSSEHEDIRQLLESKYLPKTFKWLTIGENLTIRQLKERLNHSIQIMSSLITKNYSNLNSSCDKPSIKFDTCAAVAYLESRYPKEYYELIKNEEKFANLIIKSYSLKHNNNNEELLTILKEEYDNTYMDDKIIKENNEFKNDIVKLLKDGIIDEDYKMYFYTYPKNNYIKNAYEKFVCDAILLPTTFELDIKKLNLSITKLHDNNKMGIVRDTLRKVIERDELTTVVCENDILLSEALNIDLQKTKKVVLSKIISNHSMLKTTLELIKNLKHNSSKLLLKELCDSLKIHFLRDDTVTQNDYKLLRKGFMQVLYKDINLYNTLYLNDDDTCKIPMISKDELHMTGDPNIFINLIDPVSVNTENYKYILEYITSKKLIPMTYEKAKRIITKILEVIEHNNVIGEFALNFLYINSAVDDELFEFILNNSNDVTAICKYLDSVYENISFNCLNLLDEKCMPLNISNNVLRRLNKENLYCTYLLSCSEAQFKALDYDNNDTAINIFEAFTKIFTNHSQIFIEKRKLLIKYCKTFASNFIRLFKPPYPIILEEELTICDNFSQTLNCICGELVTKDNYMYIVDWINNNTNTKDKCIDVFNHLFTNSSEMAIPYSNIKAMVFDAFDFDKIPFYLMSTEEKELCVSSIESAKSLTSPQYALEFMEKTNSLIEKLELTVIKNSTYHDRYISLINRLNTFTEKTLDFILNHPFIGLNTNITTELLNKDMFEYYVISKTLFNKNFAYEPEKVSNDIYVQIYKNNKGHINEYMQLNEQFLNMILINEYFKDLPNTQIKDLYKLPQTESFIRYVFEKTSSYDLREYLNSIKTFNGMDAKRVFVDLICDPKYIKIIDSIPFKDSLLYKIKEDGLNRKFGRKWKKYWGGRI